MKSHWTDQDLERMIHGLKDEPTGEAFWKQRVWQGIESRLPEESRKRLTPVWYRRPGVLRWGLVAAGLLVMLGGWNFQARQADMEVAEYMDEMSVPLENTVGETDHALAPELFKASTEESMETEEPASYLEVVFENV